ncbi:uncharacterized protein L969DRAFT_84280 [Mixia osmundae IAM 14324]|uniref:SH3 domain-containing protein n=1 Tax=Mixia osmundae (strain CBS 9802 / IAM 14324 / JCM 22182 / KY 12970) TaxID=764103 RepID=G7E2U1_MIXOS|nr:uncharacterized protein L969DRAFT_84280 [Mixia osmundae IAM 14324]KEI42425.1 hypothetical protein L969DRAFT_84280 [Mixia osmundae IAM 14324]GAA97285.1 hypothetical protein E5Q_03963 [Mixia osmundae IAM 14324]
MKRIERFRQRANEKIGAVQAQTGPSQSLQTLQASVEAKRSIAEKIQDVATGYVRQLGKKKPSAHAGGEGLLPIESLALVVSDQAETMPAESEYSQALRAFGAAHSDIATFQTEYVDTLNNGYLDALERQLIAISEYKAQSKKLTDRRLTYDSVLGKIQKSKTEKAALEEELRSAKAKFESTQDDVQARALAIQGSDLDSLANLTAFVEAELRFVTSYKSRLEAMLDEWPDDQPGTPSAGLHQRSSTIKSRTKPVQKHTRQRSVSHSSSDNETAATASRLDPEAIKGRGRSLSNVSAASNQSDRSLKNRAKGVSSAVVGGMPKLGSIRLPGHRARYEDLDDNADLSPVLDTTASLAVPHSPAFRRTHTAPPATQTLRTVVATFDYTASADDEVTLKAGDHLLVSREINAEWWTGQNARTKRDGMFPSNYTKPLSPVSDDYDSEVSAPSRTTSMHKGSDEGHDRSSSPDGRSQALAELSKTLVAPNIGNRSRSGSTSSIGHPGRRPPPPPLPRSRRGTLSKVTNASPFDDAEARPPNNETAPDASLLTPTAGDDDIDAAYGSVSALRKRLFAQ